MLRWLLLRAKPAFDPKQAYRVQVELPSAIEGTTFVEFTGARASSGIVLPPHVAAHELEVVDADGKQLQVDFEPLGKWQAVCRMLATVDPGGEGKRGRALFSLLAADRTGMSRRSFGASLWQLYLAALLRPLDHAPWMRVRASLRNVQSVRMHPGPQLRLGVAGEWISSGSDPGFVATFSGAPLAKGWYLFDCPVVAGSADAPAGRLYVDFGQGFNEHESVLLDYLAGPGVFRGLIVFDRPVIALRFDPLDTVGSFHMGGAVLRHVGRMRALWWLVGYPGSGRGGDGPGIFVRIARVGAYLLEARRLGLSAAAHRLYHRPGLSPSGMDSSYREWIEKYDDIPRTASRLVGAASLAVDASRKAPLFSVLVPVYNTREDLLRSCLDSVLAQDFESWELCLVDDASSEVHVAAVLSEYAARDSRIHVHSRSVNGHISRASQDALEMARGRYVALLDHDDLLRPHALGRVAEALTANPTVRLVYSDEDKIDESKNRFHPNFKPDWNPDLLLSQNYICHLAVIDRVLALKQGGFRVGYEGSQDHDLFLRCTGVLSPSQIHHIPEILYHWRATEGSTALERGAKDYAAAAGTRAVADFLVGTDGAAVEQLPHGHYRVRWPVPAPAPKVSLIIPTRDRLDLLQRCIESIFEKTSYKNYEIVVVDNQSSEPRAIDYLQEISALPNVRVLKYDAPFNYSAINNYAVSCCDSMVIGLINNDVEVISADWLDELVAHAMRDGVGAVGAMLYYPDDTIQHAGVVLGVLGVANHFYLGQPRGYPGHGARALVAQNVSAVTAACLLVRRTRFIEVGGLDEKQLPVAFNDVDLCLKLLEAGYRNVWTPFAELYHHESASRGREDTPERQARFASEVAYMRERWGEKLDNDPAYNPNLTVHRLDGGLAFPPRQRLN